MMQRDKRKQWRHKRSTYSQYFDEGSCHWIAMVHHPEYKGKESLFLCRCQGRIRHYRSSCGGKTWFPDENSITNIQDSGSKNSDISIDEPVPSDIEMEDTTPTSMMVQM
ncbi:hypothetical protein G5714_002818 [Onychostoma macrolepis]|uniref:Uncharacterized protein n=1 Tax=Onychostoma macrolepis TaxID=369639 RepID=A0A7J6D7R3_9TELE|nr:hypothetical protein G5714_002818 [Onychostoma macrolepis]